MSSSNVPLIRAVNDYTAINGTRLNLATGQLQATGNDFDVALQGSGFFVVQTSDGVKYTRNGQFKLGADRTLITSAGDPVMGEGGVIRLPAGQLSVSTDGTMSVDGALVGRLRVIDFPPATALEAVGNGYFDAPAANARPATQIAIRQGAIEQSNVDPIAEAIGLVALQRHAEMLQRALTMFHTELNKVAVEDIPRL
jgi:flagellar basal-body rod protein FlgF/flagellar basal-body rod protein FlgG